MKRILFLHPCKTGGNSLKAAITGGLGGLCCNPQTNGLHWHAQIDEVKEKFNLKNYFVVTTIRCPFRRAVSHYEYHRNILQLEDAIKYDFNEFFSDEFRPKYVDDYFFPCWQYAQHADFIINYEFIEKDFKLLCAVRETEVSLPHKNLLHYNKSTDRLKKRFNQKTIDFISARFADDIREFGYSFENIGK